MLDNTWWTFIGLLLFLALLGYLGVYGKMAALLDRRARAIADELEEAKRLRSEAEALLAEYQQKRLAAEREAVEIVESAKAEAARMTADAEIALKDLVDRRTKTVEGKIAQAEQQAIAEVKALAADVAIKAAAKVLQVKVSGEVADQLIGKSISAVKKRLN